MVYQLEHYISVRDELWNNFKWRSNRQYRFPSQLMHVRLQRPLSQIKLFLPILNNWLHETCLNTTFWQQFNLTTLINFRTKGNSLIWFIIPIFKSLFAALTATKPGGGEGGGRPLHKSEICPQVLPHRFNFSVNKIWNHYSFFFPFSRKVRTSA